MATKPIRINFDPSKNLYALIWNEAHQVLDADNTFKSLGSASNPTIALTAQTGRGGGSLDLYAASVDLARVNKTLTRKEYSVAIYERAGGSPAPTTDRLVGEQTYAIVAADDTDFPIEVEFNACNTTTSGNEVTYLVTLRRNGRRLDVHALDAAATVVLSAREFDAADPHFTASSVTVRSDGDFEVVVEATAPATVYAPDRQYQHTLVFTVAGETFEYRVPVANYG